MSEAVYTSMSGVSVPRPGFVAVEGSANSSVRERGRDVGLLRVRIAGSIVIDAC